MKKLLLSVVFSVLYVTSASADMGVNVGVSGNAGIFAASASEQTTNAGGSNQNGSEHGSAGWASMFLEATVGDKLMVGIDYVPQSLETDTTESARKETTMPNPANPIAICTAPVMVVSSNTAEE